jgi:hypothetical protein
MISFLISVLPPEPRGITDAAEAASLKPTCIADDRPMRQRTCSDGTPGP